MAHIWCLFAAVGAVSGEGRNLAEWGVADALSHHKLTKEFHGLSEPAFGRKQGNAAPLLDSQGGAGHECIFAYHVPASVVLQATRQYLPTLEAVMATINDKDGKFAKLGWNIGENELSRLMHEYERDDFMIPGGHFENPKSTISAWVMFYRNAWLAMRTLPETSATRLAMQTELHDKHDRLLVDALEFADYNFGGLVCERDDWFSLIAHERYTSSVYPAFRGLMGSFRESFAFTQGPTFAAALGEVEAHNGTLKVCTRAEWGTGGIMPAAQEPLHGTPPPAAAAAAGRAHFTLKNGVQVPLVGQGGQSGEGQYENCMSALRAGIRLLDTAMLYGTQQDVGRAVHDSGVPRNEITVMSKIGGEGTEEGLGAETRATFFANLKKLNLTYVDIYMIHHQVPGRSVCRCA